MSVYLERQVFGHSCQDTGNGGGLAGLVKEGYKWLLRNDLFSGLVGGIGGGRLVHNSFAQSELYLYSKG